eukprot:2029203-Amphidinium_carterae.3
MRNGLCLTVDGYRGYATLHWQPLRPKGYNVGRALQLCRPHQGLCLRVGTTTGVMTSSMKTVSMDYINKIYNKLRSIETTSFTTRSELTTHTQLKHQLLLHKKKEDNCNISTYKLHHNITIIQKSLLNATTRCCLLN